MSLTVDQIQQAKRYLKPGDSTVLEYNTAIAILKRLERDGTPPTREDQQRLDIVAWCVRNRCGKAEYIKRGY